MPVPLQKNHKATPVKNIFDKYPLVKKFFRERNTIGVDMIGPQPQRLKELQERAFNLIDQHGTGTNAEKEAAMICAACIIEPPSLYYNMMGLFTNYGEQVEKVIERVVGTPAGMNYDPMLAMARAASGTAMMEDISNKLKNGEKLDASAQVVLDALKTSFGADSNAYVALAAPDLMSVYETTRDKTYSALQKKADENKPKYKPDSGNFDL